MKCMKEHMKTEHGHEILTNQKMVTVESITLPNSAWSVRVRISFPDGYDVMDAFEDMKGYLGSEQIEATKKVLMAAPHFDKSREVHEFKGFFLPEV